MTLVLAGYYGISLEEAEELKKDPSKEADVFPIIKPVVEQDGVHREAVPGRTGSR